MPPQRSLDGIRLSVRQPVLAVPLVAQEKPKPTGRVKTPYRAILWYSVIGAYLYLLASPLIPSLAMSSSSQLPPLPTATPVPTVLAAVSAVPVITPSPEPIPGPNRLTLAFAGIDGQIYDGETEATLDKGIWHRPQSSTPDKGGNTVLAAHRYMFLSGGNTFYNLDKVKVGDQFSLVWNGVLYHYTVTETKTVTSRSVDIENNTTDPEVTLYTCTPLWTSENRLVVIGKPVVSSN